MYLVDLFQYASVGGGALDAPAVKSRSFVKRYGEFEEFSIGGVEGAAPYVS